MVSNSLDKSSFDYLCNAILSLETPEEAADFLSDICTVPEIKSMTQRLHVAKMLYTNYVYTDIVTETGASTATISRVNRTLNDGRNNEISGKGYKCVLSRMGEDPSVDRRKRGKTK